MPRRSSSTRLRRMIREIAERRAASGCANCGDPDRFGYLHVPIGAGTCRVMMPVRSTTYGATSDGRPIVTQRMLRDGATLHVVIGPEV